MKGWVVIAALSICVILQPVWAADFTLDLKSPTTDEYTRFLDAIRNEAKDPKGLTYDDIPVMAGDAVKGQFFRVDLVGNAGTVSLALLKSDLYLMGYLSRNSAGKFEAHHFQGAMSTKDIDKVFPEAKGVRPVEIKYKENYSAIESNAGVKSRRFVGFGIEKLDGSITDIYGKDLNTKKEATFLLLAIQMVSEAARFKYIENEVTKQEDFPTGFTPSVDILVLEDNWSKITLAIKDFSVEGIFTKEFTFTDSSDNYKLEVKVKDHVSNLGVSLCLNLSKKGDDLPDPLFMGSSVIVDSDDRAAAF